MFEGTEAEIAAAQKIQAVQRGKTARKQQRAATKMHGGSKAQPQQTIITECIAWDIGVRARYNNLFMTLDMYA